MDLIAVKKKTYGQLHGLIAGAEVTECYSPDAKFLCNYPVNELSGPAQIETFWQTLHSTMPDLERCDLIFVGGNSLDDPRMAADYTGRPLVAAMGYYQGTFENDLFGIPATKGLVHLRFAEIHHVSDGLIHQSYVLLDLLDLMRQANVWPLVKSLGAEGMWPGPALQDGIILDACNPVRGQEAFNIVNRMHQALLSYDGKSLNSMKHAQYWDENFLWYGPSGIGMARGMNGFRAHHQIPFLSGFPDRGGAGHYARIGDGDYVVTGGWPSVVGTHLGEWLGIAPTGQRIEMRVMDFYRLEGSRIKENWVPIDIIHMLSQMGVEVLQAG